MSFLSAGTTRIDAVNGELEKYSEQFKYLLTELDSQHAERGTTNLCGWWQYMGVDTAYAIYFREASNEVMFRTGDEAIKLAKALGNHVAPTMVSVISVAEPEDMV